MPSRFETLLRNPVSISRRAVLASALTLPVSILACNRPTTPNSADTPSIRETAIAVGVEATITARLPSAKPAPTPIPEQRNTEREHTVNLVFEPHASVKTPITPELLAKERSIIEQRLKALAPSSSNLQTDSQNRMLIQASTDKDLQVVVETLGQVGLLEFINAGQNYLQQGVHIATSEGTPLTDQPWDKNKVYTTVLQNRHIKNSSAGTDESGRPMIQLTLTDEGTKIFAQYTERHIGTYLSIVMDKQVISSPVINGAITNGKVPIKGKFTPDEVNKYVIQLKSGPLPFNVTMTAQLMNPRPDKTIIPAVKPTEALAKPAEALAKPVEAPKISISTERFQSPNLLFEMPIPQGWQHQYADLATQQMQLLMPGGLRVLFGDKVELFSGPKVNTITTTLGISSSPADSRISLDSYAKNMQDSLSPLGVPLGTSTTNIGSRPVTRIDTRITNAKAFGVEATSPSDPLPTVSTYIFVDRAKLWRVTLFGDDSMRKQQMDTLSSLIANFTALS